MNQTLITKINDVDIMTVESDGDIFVPIKPICDALGIKDAAQCLKIQNDDFLASAVSTVETTAVDGNTREMFALPLRYVSAWLGTINSDKDAPKGWEDVARYRRECIDVLYYHFQQKARRVTEQAQAEAALLAEKIATKNSIKESRRQLKRIEAKLSELQQERLNPQPTLF